MMEMRKMLPFISLCILLAVCTGCANIKGAGQDNSGKESGAEAEESLEKRADGELGDDKSQDGNENQGAGGSQDGNVSGGQQEANAAVKGQSVIEGQLAFAGQNGENTADEAELQPENENARIEDDGGGEAEPGDSGAEAGTEQPDGAPDVLDMASMEFTDIEPMAVYTTANVNVRLAPSTEAEILHKASRGTVYEKNGEGNGWSRISIDGKNYYIKSDYLREKKAPGEGGGHLIAIDAGHQSRANTEKEPLGPGSSEMKMKVSGGTRGTTTGLYEYELTLTVSQKLKAELESRGYEVYMVRESHDVDISNSQRAQMAYDSGAEVFVRIHANGSENSAANGAMTICPTAQNPYVAGLYADSRRLSDNVLDGLTASAGCKKERVWETDTMSGINWSMIPVTIVEIGYMTNPEEDTKLADDGYQQLIAIGIADGIDVYFSTP